LAIITVKLTDISSTLPFTQCKVVPPPAWIGQTSVIMWQGNSWQVVVYHPQKQLEDSWHVRTCSQHLSRSRIHSTQCTLFCSPNIYAIFLRHSVHFL